MKKKQYGYIIRDEIVLQGKDTENEMIQIRYEQEKVSKGDSVFRYYSKSEENLIEQIEILDEQINKAIAENESMVISSDMLSLEAQIEETLNEMYNTNEIRKLEEYINKIETYEAKKIQIIGEYSVEGSLIKQLVQERTEYENQLNLNSEVINSPISGIVSYRVDGLEEILIVDDFSYLNTSTLESYDLKIGAVIPQTKEKGKIVNNFYCYIAGCTNTEKASGAEIGDVVTLRLSNTKEIEATIIYIVEEDEENRILVFEIKDQIEELIEYRKISFDIIWWEFYGYKISNSAISIEEDDIAYIERNKAGYKEKIYVKILRQNNLYSIVENYTEEELQELGFSEQSIEERYILKLHDEIILH